MTYFMPGLGAVDQLTRSACRSPLAQVYGAIARREDSWVDLETGEPPVAEPARAISVNMVCGSEGQWREAMRVTLEVPEDLARLLGEGSDDLTRAALEALALEGLRAGKLTVAQARRLLAVSSRYEMDGFLKAHGVLLPLTVDDVKRDAETASSFRNR